MSTNYRASGPIDFEVLTSDHLLVPLGITLAKSKFQDPPQVYLIHQDALILAMKAGTTTEFQVRGAIDPTSLFDLLGEQFNVTFASEHETDLFESYARPGTNLIRVQLRWPPHSQQS